MELTQLEFFTTVVEEGSFSKAAERVYRTQPAVSIAIRRLEENHVSRLNAGAFARWRGALPECP